MLFLSITLCFRIIFYKLETSVWEPNPKHIIINSMRKTQIESALALPVSCCSPGTARTGKIRDADSNDIFDRTGADN